MSSSFVDGRTIVTTAGTRVQLSDTPVEGPFVEIQALGTNVGVIVVGTDTVVAAAGSRRGIALSPGEPRGYSMSDLRDVWLDATVSGDGVSWYVKRV